MVLQATLESFQRDYDVYHGVHSGPSEASRESNANDISLERMFEQNFPWNQAACNEDVTEHASSTAQRLIQVVSRAVFATREGYVNLYEILQFTDGPCTGELGLQQRSRRSGGGKTR